MSILALITAFLTAASKYFEYKAQYTLFDIQDKYDARIDKLEKQRAELRLKTDQTSQKKADKILDEIIEEKEKRRIFLDSLEKKV